MDSYFYTEIPIWDNGTWTLENFGSVSEFKDFVKSTFKEPGKYNFDESVSIFNSQALFYKENGYFCKYAEGSKDYRKYWDDQKIKCRKGIIVKHKSNTWYLPRDYYMWVNFLPINDKIAKKFDFPQVWDTQLHMALYECLAELHWEHASILKKRQIASSYFHAAKAINLIWFEESPIIKMGATLKDYINEKGTWKFLDEYRSFLNDKTAWYRPMNPGKVMMWQQKIDETDSNGRTKSVGGKGVIQGITFDKSPTTGVGGACRFFFYEEAGIAPSMNTTYQFATPGMQMGDITTGIFVAAGSVGELDQCEPLKNFIERPRSYGIYAVETDLYDDKGTIKECGLFIPEQWSMPPYIDEYGNSLVQVALDALDKKFEQWKKELPPQDYQLKISQHPRNITEAFANRTVSIFPLNLVSQQKRRIEEKEYSIQYVDLQRSSTGDIEFKPSNKLPILEFPIQKNQEDKEGVVVIYEQPDKDTSFGTYYASIDPVSEGKTTTSESLCSIYVYKNPVEVTRIKNGESEIFLEGDKIVASWCGRFDDIKRTHERLEMLIEAYNAWTIVENNVHLFIQYMIHRKKQKYLVPKSQIIFLKDLGSNNNVYQDYGWKNTGTLFSTNMLSYLIEFLQEEIDCITDDNGNVLKRKYGIERIPDIMALKEMEAYTKGLNVDRLVALAALVTFAKVQQSNRGYKKRVEYMDKKHLDKSKELFKLPVSPFRHVGMGGRGFESTYKRNPFKNLR